MGKITHWQAVSATRIYLRNQTPSTSKLQLLQDPSELNGDNLNNIRRETSRQFRNKKREYLKDKIDELAVNSKNKNIRDLYRGISDFNRGYQPSSNLVKDENGELLADSQNILNRWRNYFSQLLNVHRVSDVRQTGIDTAEPLIPDPSPFEVESAIAKLKRYKSPGSDQIPAELIQAGGEILRSKIHNLITSIWHKEKLPDQWSLLLYQVTIRGIKLTVVIIGVYHCYQLHIKFCPIFFFQV
ncbi:hypothetical protein B7P43_G18298 [Cryptotermes secundus]|uniref:Reverse transcriptase domain-containing protein n=1 Tax=Cryptotermes secundus TaxID=105785 RepID=A0A2J7Q184_9NEOP|nr:hypothetical protein B7P43_G18298 [Cryptotermes secundus]